MKQSFCKKRFGIIQLKHTLEIWLFRVPSAIYIYMYIYMHTFAGSEKLIALNQKKGSPPIKKIHPGCQNLYDSSVSSSDPDFFSDIFLEQFHPILPISQVL